MSRSQSPSRFMDMTVNMIATPGTKETHHWVMMRSHPSATISPQVGVGLGIPAPKKLRVDSRIITKPTRRVASTTTLSTYLAPYF